MSRDGGSFGGGGRGYSGLRGNISTYFGDGENDHGASGGKAFVDGFDHGTPYRYGYPNIHLDTEHYHSMYHTIFDPCVCHLYESKDVCEHRKMAMQCTKV